MWDCAGCGCMAIAASIAMCPACGKERHMPKATSGGSSNQGDPTEPPVASEEAPDRAEVPAPVEVAATDTSVAPTAPGENGPDGTPPASEEEALANEAELLRQEQELQAQIEALRNRNKRV